jgi:hypothetical protein
VPVLHLARRDFLSTFIGGIASTAAVRTWPFRVYSFPTDIVIASSLPAGFVSLALVQEAFRIKHPLYGDFNGTFGERPFPRQRLLPWQEGYVSRRAWVDELPDVAPPKDWKPIVYRGD